MDRPNSRINSGQTMSPFMQAIGFVLVSLIIWVLSTIIFMAAFTWWLLWGSLLILGMAPFNWVIHAVLLVNVRGRRKWKFLLLYLICAHALILCIGYSEEKWITWALETTKLAAPIYLLILIQFIGNDWIFNRIRNYIMKTETSENGI